MIRLAFYFAIGALLHLAFVGQHFDFNNAWTWLWLFGWPFMLLFSMVAFVATAGIFALLGIGGLIAFAAFVTWSSDVIVSAKAKLKTRRRGP